MEPYLLEIYNAIELWRGHKKLGRPIDACTLLGRVWLTVSRRVFLFAYVSLRFEQTGKSF